MIAIPHTGLSQFGTAAFEKVGVPHEDAATAVDALVRSDLRGVDSHGIRLVAIYVPRIQAGGVAAKPDIQVVRDSPASALLDGGSGLGQVVGTRAMRLAIEKAQHTGAGFVSARNSTHCGAAAHYAMLARESDMIGMCFSNTFVSMAVCGAAGSAVGNNPMAIAIPTGRHAPFVIDMATSITAWQKIYMLADRGEMLGPGQALDPHGKPTQDPKQAHGGTLLPLGGPKGAGLAVAIDLLSGVLSGGAYGKHVGALMTDLSKSENTSTSYLAVDVSHFLPIDQFKQRADQFMDELKSAPLAEGFDEITLAGELEHRRMQQRLAEGIPLAEKTREALRELGQKIGVPFEW